MSPSSLEQELVVPTLATITRDNLSAFADVLFSLLNIDCTRPPTLSSTVPHSSMTHFDSLENTQFVTRGRNVDCWHFGKAWALYWQDWEQYEHDAGGVTSEGVELSGLPHSMIYTRERRGSLELVARLHGGTTEQQQSLCEVMRRAEGVLYASKITVLDDPTLGALAPKLGNDTPLEVSGHAYILEANVKFATIDTKRYAFFPGPWSDIKLAWIGAVPNTTHFASYRTLYRTGQSPATEITEILPWLHSPNELSLEQEWHNWAAETSIVNMTNDYRFGVIRSAKRWRYGPWVIRDFSTRGGSSNSAATTTGRDFMAQTENGEPYILMLRTRQWQHDLNLWIQSVQFGLLGPQDCIEEPMRIIQSSLIQKNWSEKYPTNQ